MKSRTLPCITAMTLCAALAVPVWLAAQEEQQAKNEVPLYRVVDLGTLGGTFTSGQGINNQGWAVGVATLAHDTRQHSFLWLKGLKIDLGTFGGPNSGVFGTGGPNERGEVVGWAETSIPDPLGENNCGNFRTCLPFLWQNGVMIPLPTLGGNNGFANDVNNRGQVVGVAENMTQDSTCPPGFPFFIQTPPVVWEKGKIHKLPTVSGDPDGFAASINDIGQVVGSSGNCTISLHALLWQNTEVTDLGNLGGTLFSQGSAINNRGQVVGSSDLSGDTNFFAGPFSNNHAFVWQNGVIHDLGTLPGDATSFANAINNKGQAVGNGSRAILWRSEGLTDLNTLVPGPPFSPLYLLAANDINEQGEIVGVGLAINGELHAFVAIPCDDDHADCKESDGISANNESIQPALLIENQSVLSGVEPRPGGQVGREIDIPRLRQFRVHYFPNSRTGPARSATTSEQRRQP